MLNHLLSENIARKFARNYDLRAGTKDEDMARFTDLSIARYKTKDKKYTVTEGEGLYLQVSPKGKKTWLHYYKSGGKRKWLRLGEYPAMNLKEARKKNEEAAEITMRGEDPKEIEKTNHDPTLRELFEEWFGKAVDKRGKPWSAAHKRNVGYMFDKDILPKLGGRKVREIRKSDIRRTLEKIETRAPNQALQVYRRMSRLFNYAASRDIIEVSPMAALDPIGSQSKKNRYLTEEEIKTFLDALPSADMAPNTASALEIILRTGQRPSEVCGTHKDEIKDNWWTIPCARSKNGMENRVYLTPKVLALFGEPNKHGYFFPSLRDPKKPVSHTVLSKALRRSLTGKEKRQESDASIPVEKFTPHDLRRTCATCMAELGFTDEIIGAVLNHKKATVTGIYNQYRYDKEKQAALEAWNRKLSQIVTGKKPEKVVNIREA
jgi:integrase